MSLKSIVLVSVFILTSCSGSPARMLLSGTNPQSFADERFKKLDVFSLCNLYMKRPPYPEQCRNLEKRNNSSAFTYACNMHDEALQFELKRRKIDYKDYCPNPIAYNQKKAEERKRASLETRVYNIDTLKVVTHVVKDLRNCVRYGHYIELTGSISPDSSFAVEELLSRIPKCKINENQHMPTRVFLSSGGGLLSDGYKMGRTFRNYGVTTIIKDESVCASSCALAFLGGLERIIEPKGIIMFHAPYLTLSNGEIDCNLGTNALHELKNYYAFATNTEKAERLLDRTMWYCSSSDGWVLKGGNAAELFGIATQSEAQ